MRKTFKSSLMKLVSLAIVLCVCMGMVPISAGNVAAQDNDSGLSYVTYNNLNLHVYVNDQNGGYKDQDVSVWAKGDYKVSAELTEAFPAEYVFYKKSGSTSWIEGGQFSGSVKEPVEYGSSTPDQPQTKSTLVFQIMPVEGENYNGTYDLKFSNYKNESDKGEDDYHEAVFNYAVMVKSDNVFDTLTVNHNAPSSGYTKSLKVSGSVSDIAGVDSLTYTKGEKKETLTPDDAGKFSFEITNDYSGDITVTAVDKAGNTKTETISNVNIDSTKPEIDIDSADEVWTKDSVTVNGSATDSNSGVKEVRYAVIRSDKEIAVDVKNDKKASFDSSTGEYNFTFTRDQIPESGNEIGDKYYLVVYAVDNAGNISFSPSEYKAVTVNYDLKKCVIIELAANHDTWTNDTVKIDGTVRDDESGFDAAKVNRTVFYRCYTDDSDKGNWKPIVSAKLNGSNQIKFQLLLSSLDTGIYKIEFIAYDKLGNESTFDEALAESITYPITVYIDKSAPDIDKKDVKVLLKNNIEAEKAVYTNAPATISGTVTEEQSALSKVEVMLNDGKNKWIESTDIKESDDKKTYSFNAELPQTTYKGGFKLKLTNSAGASEEIEFTEPELYLDFTEPVIKKTDINVDVASWTKQATVSGKVTDADAGVKSIFYKKSSDDKWTQIPESDVKFSDDGKSADFSFTTEAWDNYEGDYDIKCEDKAGDPVNQDGNIAVLKNAVSVKLDNTLPKVNEVQTEYTGDWTNGKLKFTVTPQDNGDIQSGIASVLYSFDNNSGYPQDVEVKKNGAGKFEFEIDGKDLSVENGKDGGYFGKISIAAKDNAGNISELTDSKSVEVKIDSEKGLAEFIQSPSDWTNDKLVVKVKFVDDKSKVAFYNSGYDYAEYKTDSQDWKKLENDKLVRDGDEYIITFDKADYNGSYRFRFADKAGNKSDDIVIQHAMQDISNPEVASANISDAGNWSQNTVTIQGTVKDLAAANKDYNSGIKTVYYKKANESEWTDIKLTEGYKLDVNEAEKTAEFKFVLPPDSYNGAYDFKVEDNAKNFSAFLRSGNVLQDMEKPVVSTEITVTPAGWTNGEVTITGSVSDNLSGVDKVYYKKHSEPDTAWAQVPDENVTRQGTAASFTVNLPKDNYYGTYDIKCSDVATNESDTVTTQKRVCQDTVAPTIGIACTEPDVIWTLLDGITLGMFNFSNSNSKDLTYTLTLDDNISGVKLDTLNIRYKDEMGAEHTDSVTEKFTDYSTSDLFYTPEFKIKHCVLTFTVPSDMTLADVHFEVDDYAADSVKNRGENGQDNQKKIVDKTSPKGDVSYSEFKNQVRDDKILENSDYVDEKDTVYYSDDATLTFTVNEKNFYPAGKGTLDNTNKPIDPQTVFTVTKDGATYTGYQLSDWTAAGGDKYTAAMKFTEDGSYKVELAYSDYSANKMNDVKTAEIVIDRSKPQIEVQYNETVPQQKLDGVEYYNKARKATVTITEPHFDATKVDWTITAKNFLDAKVDNAYTFGTWSHDGDKHTIEIDFAKDANYTFNVNCKDLSENPSDERTADKFTVDTKAPVLQSVEYDENVIDRIWDGITFGYSNMPITVKLTFVDETSGVYCYNRNAWLADGANTEHNKAIPYFDSNQFDFSTEDGITTITFQLPKEELTQTNNFDGFYKSLVKDRALNSIDTENSADTAKRLVVDNIKPIGSVALDTDTLVNTVTKDSVTTKYYNGAFSGTITLNEEHLIHGTSKFFMDGVAKAIDLGDWKKTAQDTYTYKFTFTNDGVHSYSFQFTDPSGNDSNIVAEENLVIDTKAPTGIIDLTNKNLKRKVDDTEYYQDTQTAVITIDELNFDPEKADVKISAKDSAGNDVTDSFSIGEWQNASETIHKLTIDFDKDKLHDANFDLTVNFTDLANWKTETLNRKFTVDNKPPVVTNITYDTKITDIILNGISFGFFDAKVQVKVEFLDEVSGGYCYNREGLLDKNVSSINKAIAKYTENQSVTTENGKTEITFELPKEALTDKNNFRGTLNTLLEDRSGNVYQTKSNTEAVPETNRHLVIDTITPTRTYTVKSPVDTDNGYRYYNGSIPVSFTITEANFYPEDVKFTLDGSDKSSSLTWTSLGNDRYKADYTITGDAVHDFRLSYTDRSGHKMQDVVENKLVVDTTAPQISSKTYSNRDVKNRGDNGREYLTATQAITLTIKERNFHTKWFKPRVTAVDVTGASAVSGVPYKTSSWKHSGDYHTVTLTFESDANYSYYLDFMDLAQNKIKTDTPYHFTIDRVQPQNISFDYSLTTPKNIVGSTRYYDTQATVRITSRDVTSGVNEFDYEGILAAGASSINRSVVKTAIQRANITRSGYDFTATFYIPASALGSGNSFNGNVQATAIDYSRNTRVNTDATTLVCDNIAPVGQEPSMTSPVNTDSGINYYNGNIEVTFTINEANFTDGSTTFMLDGSQVPLTWSHNGDTHTATYTITGDGKHNFTLDCQDASGNKMTQITKDNMIIDTKASTITVDKSILDKSANNADTVSFKVTVTDDNIRSSDIKPKLKAIVKKTSSKTPEKTISELVEKDIKLTSVSEGKSYIYTVDNLDTDGYYSFTCTATDLAKHVTKSMSCTGSDNKKKDTEEFNFSVNRDGSVFWVDSNVENNSYTNKNDIEVTLHEVNVDKTVTGSTLKVINDNETDSVKLDSKNYSGNKRSSAQSGDAGWYESTYTLNNDSFAFDSKFTVVLTTNDEAGNVNISSDSEISVVSFIVDRTAPVVSSNVSNGEIIDASTYDVEFKVADRNLDIDSLKVKLNDADIKCSENGDNSFKFKIDYEKLDHKIEINVKDKAGNPLKDPYVVSPVTVSTNPLVRWFANTALFWSTIGGIVLLAAAIIFLVVRAKKKKA